MYLYNDVEGWICFYDSQTLWASCSDTRQRGEDQLPALAHHRPLLLIPLDLFHAVGYFTCTYVVTSVHIAQFCLFPGPHPESCAHQCRPYKWVHSSFTGEWWGAVYQEHGPEWRCWALGGYVPWAYRSLALWGAARLDKGQNRAF